MNGKLVPFNTMAKTAPPFHTCIYIIKHFSTTFLKPGINKEKEIWINNICVAVGVLSSILSSILN